MGVYRWAENFEVLLGRAQNDANAVTIRRENKHYEQMEEEEVTESITNSAGHDNIRHEMLNAMGNE